MAMTESFYQTNLLEINTNFLLHRPNFDIAPSISLGESLDNDFVTNGLEEIIKRIVDEGMLLLYYSKSGNIIIAKVYFAETNLFKLMIEFPEDFRNRGPQICHLSSRNKRKKIIITTYNNKNLANVIIINFDDSDNEVFSGVMNYVRGKKEYTTHIVAVMDRKNKEQKPEKLEKRVAKLKFQKKSNYYEDGLIKLKKLRDLRKKNKDNKELS